PPSALETGTRKSADTAFRKGQWAGAEKAYLAYSRQMPPPKDINGALVRIAECRVNRGDAPGALRALGQVFSDVSAAKREPDALADAYALQHGVHVKTPSKAGDRARALDDFRKRLPNHPRLPKLYEAEADTLTVDGKVAEAVKYYGLAGEGLSEQGKRIYSLLSGHASVTSEPLSGGDIATLASVMELRPEMALPLCDALAKRKEGWQAEEARVVFLDARRRYAEARPVLERLVRQGEGPTDLFALRLAHLTAFKEKRPEGIALYKEWFRSYPNSALTGDATCQYAEALFLAGNAEECVAVVERFLSGHQGGFEKRAKDLLARAKDSITRKQNAVAKAEQAARAKAREIAPSKAEDPLLGILAKAQGLYDARKYSEALQVLTPFSGQQSRPLWGKGFYLKGQCQYGQGQVGNAIETWTEVTRHAMRFTNTLSVAECRLGIARAWLEDFGEAEKALPEYRSFHEALPAKKRTPAWETEYAAALLAAGCHDEARPLLERLFEAAERNQAPNVPELAALLDLCGNGGRLPVKTTLKRPEQQRLLAADVLFAGGNWKKADSLYSAITPPLPDIEGAAYITQQRARCLARLGRHHEALKHYDKFTGEYRHVSVADNALIRAAVLHAGTLNKPRDAMRILELVVRDSAEKPAAEIAHLYLATLAWWTGQWKSAEQFHLSFLEKYPSHPLRQDILNVRLPAIAQKKH
ncbi:MAG: hypothetical protein FWH21_01445, partial [Kiritimatiellaeota bacterium]|nr:hypothetical protein [Kiritimatiellota bacterium]